VPVLSNVGPETVVKQAPLAPIDANVAGLHSSPTDWPGVEAKLSAPTAARSNKVTTKPGWSIPWPAILFAVSGCGTLILATGSLSQLVRLSRILRRATTGDERFRGLAQAAAARMGLRGAPVVCAVDASIVPFLWVRCSGPVIVLPTNLVARMVDEQISCILCHELAHYARRDYWANLFAFLVTALFWWHPVSWWARRGMRAAQEVCCDGLVLATEGANRRYYAETLLQALEFVQTYKPLHPTFVSGFGESSSLKRRFEMIANLKVIPRFSPCAATVVVTCMAAMLCVPVRGQSRTEKNVPADSMQYDIGLGLRRADSGVLTQDASAKETTDPKGQIAGMGKPVNAADSQHLKNTLLALDKHYWDAGSKGDGREIETMLADEFVSISVLGRYGKRDAVEACARYRLGDVAIHDPQVIRIGQNNAVVTYAYDCKILSANGQLLETRKDCRVTFVWEQRGGGWVIVFCHDNHG